MADDKQPPGAGGDDRTMPGGTPDETRPITPGRPDDTQVFPAAGQDDTLVGDPAGSAPTAAGPAVWSGRAEVPPAGVRGAGQTTRRWDEHREEPPPEVGGRWWMPIVIGLAALLLLGVLGYGLWLIAAADDGTEPAGGPSATAPAAPRTTAPPATREAPRPTAPQPVEVPRLAGESLADAQDRLDELGLTYRVEFEETDEEQPGRVLRTEPDGGAEVEPRSRVTLVVAAAPEEPEPSRPAPTADQSPDN